MIGPSDSFTHKIHKLSKANRDAIRGLQNMEVPPAYSAKSTVEDEESDNDNDFERWTGPPVSIHIDASISIEGTKNQIALPPHSASRPLTLTGEGIGAAHGSTQDHLPTGPAGPPQDLTPQRITRDRATQISDAVMQALMMSGIFAGTVTPQMQLEVHVDASISVKGERNIMTTIVPIRSVVSGNAQGESPSPLKSMQSETGQNSGPNPTQTEYTALSPSQASTLVDRDVEMQEAKREVEGLPQTPSRKRMRMPSPAGYNSDKKNEQKQKRSKIQRDIYQAT